MKFDFKEFIKGIIVICSYFLIQVIYCMPFSYLLIKNKISESTVYFFVFIGMAITYIVYYRKSLLNDLKDLKKNYKTIFKTTIKYWLIGFGLMILSSMILTSLNIGTAANQEQNISLFKNAPIIQSLIAIILAPITEELVFRRSFKNFTDNKHIFAITTGLIFGGIHVVSSLTSLKNLPMILHIIPYSAVGIAFGYAYKKHNNILGTMLIHALHNTIAIIEIFMLL